MTSRKLTRLMAVLLALSTLTVAAATPLPAAAQSANDVRIAGKLHASAKRKLRKRKFAGALADWQDAYRVHRSWKYTFNQGLCHMELGQPVKAWHAMQRAVRDGVPGDRKAPVEELISRVEQQLIADHAFIALDVEPADATVTLDGAPWPAPHATWTKRTTSTIALTRKGFESTTVEWEHAPGGRYQRTERLVESTVGSVRVTGTPEGAEVLLDGAPVGRLPEVDLRDVRTGPHRVVIRHPDHVTVTREVEVAPARQAVVEVALIVAPSEVLAPTASDDDRGTRFGVVKWVALGGGLAVAAVGGGLIGHAHGLGSDLQQIADDPKAADSQRWDDTVSTIDTLQPVGWALAGIGLGAVAAGVVLIVLDGPQDDADRGVETESALAPVPLQGGGGMIYSLSF